MANPGAKHVSVNLNKSSVRKHYPSHPSHFQHFNGGGGGSYGQAAAAGAGRGRTGITGGGGMVVLSRNRGAAPKVVPKLSVPPPLNLPSLRKEHEKFDISGPGGGFGGGAGTCSGGRPASSGMGWTKPIASTAALPEKSDDSRVDAHGVAGIDTKDGVTRGSGSYMPPSARSNGVGVVSSFPINRDFAPSAGKNMILRGEDFPSLQDSRPTSSGASQKQKDGLNQKQKHVVSEELVQDKRDSYHLGPTIDVHQPSRNTVGNGSMEKDGEDQGMGSLQRGDHIQKQKEYFPDPLPLVRLNPRYDWADDERDTSLGFMELGRDAGYSKSENYWDRDFDLSKPSVLPHKTPQIHYDRRGQRDNEAGKHYSSEVPKMDPYSTDLRGPSRAGGDINKWRASPFSSDGSSSQEGVNDRVTSGSRISAPSTVKDNKYVPPYHGDTGRDGNNTFYRDSTHGNRDVGLVGRQQNWNNSTKFYNNLATEHNNRDRRVMEQPNRYMGDNFQNSTSSRSYLAASVKGPPIADPILPMGRDRRFSKGEKPFSEDPFSRDIGSPGFDETDLSGGLVGVIKRKKDAAKSTEFHDPVRESFEAELERVQKMQELERQRIIEEQERALEQAQREEEERHRRIREEEERQQRVEKEAREAAWRAEQERLESIRKAEELRIAREEEKRRIHLEEERRKEAAKQKLLDLEAKMAKRQAESAKDDVFVSYTAMDEKLEVAMQEKEISRNLELDMWEDGERMVEKVTTSAPFNSFAPSTPIEMGLRPCPPRESSSVFIDGGKAINSRRKDVFENGGGFSSPPLNQEVGYYSPRRDAIGSGRAVPRKEFHAGAPSMSSRSYSKEGVQDFYLHEFGYQKDHRWNLPDADPHSKFGEMDSEFPDSAVDKYGDYAWSHGHSLVSGRPPYPERLYPYPESTELYSYGRSRYSVRQPRVLPPPIASAQRTNFRGFTEHSGPSPFLNNDSPCMHNARSESAGQTAHYGSNQGGLEPSDGVAVQQENITIEEQKLNTASRCDSPSSLSVSSPRTSPPHLSQDELDDSGDSRVTSAVEDGNRSLLTGNESNILNENSGNNMLVPSADSISAVEDDEWTSQNDEMLQLQEEYDEDLDGYREEDEVREGDDENLELNPKFVGLELEERDSSHMMDNFVLGFDEGVEVVIPSDECDKNLEPQEGSFVIPNSSISMLEERGDVGVPSNEQSFLFTDDSARTTADSSFGKFTDNKSVLHESIRQPIGVPLSSATSDVSVGATFSGNAGLPAQQSVSSSGDVSADAGVISLPALPSASPQLQFGLFSGPSLIPSPVLAIQIGSIQMPLHIHPPIGSSLTHVRPSQPSMFQFGQLRYPSPISQGILPMAPQSVSFMQGHVNLDQNAGGSVPHQPSQDISVGDVTKDVFPSREINKHPKFVSAPLEQSNGIQQSNGILFSGHNSADPSSSSGFSAASDKKIEPESGLQAEVKGMYDADSTSYLPSSKERGSRQSHHVHPTVQSLADEKNFTRHRGAGTFPGSRGRRFTYSVKNALTRSYSQADDMPVDSNVYQRRPRRTVQRTEFRVRENSDRRQTPLFGSSNNMGLDDNSNFIGKSVGVFTRHGSRRGTISNRTMKQRTESEPSASGNIVSEEINSAGRMAKEMENGLSVKSQNTSYPGEANWSRNISEDVDAPLQSGIVRIFKQSGIEATSDEDDFIQVRSKRQMLNDRREQREKEIKAKSSTTKPPHKQHFTRQNGVASRSHNKVVIPSCREESRNTNRELNTSGSSFLARNEVPTGFTAAVSHPLAPIGTLVVNSEMMPINTPQAGLSDAPNCASDPDPEAMFESKSKAKDHVQSSPTTWSTHVINQQVMSLTQTQLDEAMKPAQCDSHLSTVGGHLSKVSDPTMRTSSIIANDKSISSTASPINSLLAGEKIQFGAVTSPTVLPPSSPAVSHGIGAPGSNRPDVQMSRNFAVAENDCSLFFGKEKHSNDSCAPLQDCKAAAEAAASAVAVTAVSSNEIVGSRLGSANIPDTKSVGSADVDGITTGVARDQQSANQSQGEESLSVSLPADLSVETTPISLWPPLLSPQSSSGHMLSQLPGGASSHFPFYEMNPVLGGPIYTFSPQEESPIAQSQPQKSLASTSGPLGNWQHQSGVDSYYGPPTGIPGPFVSPPGGVPGAQGPPHMVVYNHFAPVGQYGQVGLRFMGTTYIPSGKQADWKHTPTSSAFHTGEGEINSIGMATVQHSAPNTTSPIQHLAPGSPLLPMGSPLPMFDVSSFQTAPDMSIQARWAHIPASPIHSVPISRTLHPQVEGAPALQANHRHLLDQQLPANKFPESRIPTSSDNVPNYTPSCVTSAAPFSAELVLADSLRSSAPSSGQSILAQSSSGSASIEACKTGTLDNGLNSNGKNQKASSFKAPFPRKNISAHQGNSSGYNYQRGGGGMNRNNAGNEWSHHRTGFHVRSQSSGMGFPASKMKQVYVAKQTTKASSTN